MVLLGILSQWVFTESKLFLKTTIHKKTNLCDQKIKNKEQNKVGYVHYKYDELMTSSQQNVSKMN